MRRLSVSDAARHLGLSESAIRSRIFRGTLEHEKDIYGNVWVLLSDDSNDQSIEQSPTALVEALQERIQSLERQLATAEERDRENRRLLAAALERIPAIEAPQDTLQEPRESPQTASEEPSGTQTSQEEERRERSWWQRLFGG
jgi:hypothetical protein